MPVLRASPCMRADGGGGIEQIGLTGKALQALPVNAPLGVWGDTPPRISLWLWPPLARPLPPTRAAAVGRA